MGSDTELDAKFAQAVERLGRAIRAAQQQVATDHAVTPLQIGLLQRLRQRAPRRIGQLAEDLSVTQPTTSDAVSALEHKGLVERTPDPLDRRATVVQLLDAGRELAEQVAAGLGPLEGATTAAPTEHVATALRVVLAEIARLQDIGVIGVDRSCLTCHHFRPADVVAVAHCELLQRDLPDNALRVDCPEHEPLARPKAR